MRDENYSIFFFFFFPIPALPGLIMMAVFWVHPSCPQWCWLTCHSVGHGLPASLWTVYMVTLEWSSRRRGIEEEFVYVTNITGHWAAWELSLFHNAPQGFSTSCKYSLQSKPCGSLFQKVLFSSLNNVSSVISGKQRSQLSASQS